MSNEEFAIAVYQNMEVLFDSNGDPWMTQQQIADLLGVSVPNVNTMLSYAIKHGEIPEESVIKLGLIAADGKTYNVKHYDLDAILIVGYRSKENGERTRAFRKWVSNIVRSHLRNLRAQNENLQYTLSEEQQEKHLLERQLADYTEADHRRQREIGYDYNEL